jgi:hypothetical protein
MPGGPAPGNMASPPPPHHGDDHGLTTPTFAPDGTRAAWDEADGIKVVTVPDFGAGCTTAGASPTAELLIPGGQQPDWGPADVPPASTVGPGGGGAALAAKARRARLGKALRRGLKVRVSAPADGRVRITARRGARKVAAGGRAVKAGAGAVTLRFTKSARRSLRQSRRVKLRLRVAFTPESGATQRTSLKVTLRR